MGEEATSYAFSDSQNGGFQAYREWFELLAKHRKGTSEVWLQDFHGRGGFRPFKELRCHDADGKPVEPNSEAAYDPEKLAREAYRACLHHQKKSMCDPRFRMVLMQRKKKNGELHEGPWVGLIIHPDGYVERDDYGRGVESLSLKILADHCSDLRTFVREIIGAQVNLAQANAGTMMLAHELGDSMLRRRMEQVQSVAPRQPASAEQINRRIETVAATVAEPLRLFAHAAMGVPTKPAEVIQTELQEWWATLSSDQTDQIRDLLGAAQFQAMLEVLNGPTDQFARERRWIRPSLARHMEGLRQILTAEQWKKLQELI